MQANGFTSLIPDEAAEFDSVSQLLKDIEELREKNETKYEKALKMTLALGLEPGTRQNPFQLIDEQLQVKPPFGLLDSPPGYARLGACTLLSFVLLGRIIDGNNPKTLERHLKSI